MTSHKLLQIARALRYIHHSAQISSSSHLFISYFLFLRTPFKLYTLSVLASKRKLLFCTIFIITAKGMYCTYFITVILGFMSSKCANGRFWASQIDFVSARLSVLEYSTIFFSMKPIALPFNFGITISLSSALRFRVPQYAAKDKFTIFIWPPYYK